MPGDASEPPPVAFTLRDQFNREYTEAFCAGKVTIFMIYDREGGKFGEPWGGAIGRELRASPAPPETQWVNVTVLHSVPRFLRGSAGKFLSKDPAQWTLLDWEAHFPKTYDIPAKHLGIVVCGPDCRVLFCAAVRDLDPAVVSAIVAAITAPGPAAPKASAAN